MDCRRTRFPVLLSLRESIDVTSRKLSFGHHCRRRVMPTRSCIALCLAVVSLFASPALAQVSMRTIDATWPAPPGEESWTFVEDLKKPLPFVLFWKDGGPPRPGQVDLRAGLTLQRAFPDDKGVLDTAYADLKNFLTFAKLDGKGGLRLTAEKAATDVDEAYSIEITPQGIRLLAGDPEGMRRAIFHFEELIAAADGPFLSPGVIRKSPGCEIASPAVSSVPSSGRP